MNMIILKKQFVLLMILLFCGVVSYAADNGLITKQIIIKLEKAGTLSDKIGSSKLNKITNLKVEGEMNDADFYVIRRMKCLAILDLSEIKIVDDVFEGMKDNCLPDAAFECCSCLTSLSLPTSVTSIGSAAFEYCGSLTSLSLPSGVTSIGKRAFYGCSGLTSLSLPSGVTSIGDETFYDCSGLMSLSLPSGVTSIGKRAFYGCRGLTSLSLPSGVTSIGDETFYDCSGLTSLSLPSGVTSIGKRAFEYCSSLTSLSLPSSVTSIGDEAFDRCWNLKNVQCYINDDIESYLSKGHLNFRFCTDIKYFLDGQEMTNVTIPSNITRLGEYAFQKSINLTSVYVSWETPISADTAFDGVDVSKCTLYVPQGAYQDYWLADIWGDFGNILEYDVTGVKKVTTSTDAKEVFRYSVNGQRLSAPTKGLNIVKYSDGSMKKVAVR